MFYIYIHVFLLYFTVFFFFSSRRRHTRYWRDWSSDVCSSDLRAVRPRVRLAFSLDMVGVGSTLNVRGIESRPNRSSRIALARGRALGLRPAYLRDSGVSDHAELSRAGIPASLVTWRWDVCWHERCDRPARVRAHKIAAAARLTIASLRAR